MHIRYKPLNAKRIALAHEIIDGIPDDVIDLYTFVGERGESLGCGTIACGAGWLAMHPTFNALGLHLNGIDLPQSRNSGSCDPEGALREIFGGRMNEAILKMFASRMNGTYDSAICEKLGYSITDKQLLLERMKRTYRDAGGVSK